MARSYLRPSAAMQRLVRYLADFQEANGFSPKSYRAIGAEIGTSHTQVRRLMQKALEGGILKRSGPQKLAYQHILHPPTAAGVMWVPLAECIWRKPIRWDRDQARGVWLDRSIYGLHDEGDFWVLIFPERSRDLRDRYLRLDEHAMALVRRCTKNDIQKSHWYFFEHGGEVMVSSYNTASGGLLNFRQWRKDPEPTRIDPKLITTFAEVMLVTSRPP